MIVGFGSQEVKGCISSASDAEAQVPNVSSKIGANLGLSRWLNCLQEPLLLVQKPRGNREWRMERDGGVEWWLTEAVGPDGPYSTLGISCFRGSSTVE